MTWELGNMPAIYLTKKKSIVHNQTLLITETYIENVSQ